MYVTDGSATSNGHIHTLALERHMHVQTHLHKAKDYVHPWNVLLTRFYPFYCICSPS